MKHMLTHLPHMHISSTLPKKRAACVFPYKQTDGPVSTKTLKSVCGQSAPKIPSAGLK